MADSHRALNQPAESAAALRACLELAADYPEGLYNTACGLARCVTLVGKGKTALSADQQTERQKYADQAMAVLHQAVIAGYTDTKHMRKDADLDPLRSRNDFQEFLTGLEAKAKKGGK